MPFLVECRIQQLRAQRQHQERRAQNLPGLPLCQPAVDPGKDGPRHQDVEDPKSHQRQRRPGKQLGARRHDPYPDAQAAKPTQNRGDIRQPKDQVKQAERRKAHRKPQQAAHVELFLKRGHRHGNQLPHQKHDPKQNRQKLQRIAPGHGISAHTQAHAHCQPHHGVNHKPDGARSQLECAQVGAQAVDKHVPAQAGQRAILRPRQRGRRVLRSGLPCSGLLVFA